MKGSNMEFVGKSAELVHTSIEPAAVEETVAMKPNHVGCTGCEHTGHPSNMHCIFNEGDEKVYMCSECMYGVSDEEVADEGPFDHVGDDILYMRELYNALPL